MDSRAADRRPIRGLRPGVPINGSGAITVSSDDKQPVAAVMSTAHPEDARAEPEAPVQHRRRDHELMGAKHRRLLPHREAVAHARLCAIHGAGTGSDRRVIAHGGACPVRQLARADLPSPLALHARVDHASCKEFSCYYSVIPF